MRIGGMLDVELILRADAHGVRLALSEKQKESAILLRGYEAGNLAYAIGRAMATRPASRT